MSDHDCASLGCTDDRLLHALYGSRPVEVIDGERNHVVPSFADDEFGLCACGCGAEETELLYCITMPGAEVLLRSKACLAVWVMRHLIGATS